jgi:hypothetical protein
MPTRHIALVPESGMCLSDLARVSAALQKQITRDVAPTWRVSATVDPFPSLEDVPAGYWPVIMTFRPIGSDAGIHIDDNGQPYAMIEMSPSWSLTASHVSIEMITDPFGSRSFPGISPHHDQGDVEFRGGVCDPCEHPESAYLINDVLVSDFCTPAFWEPSSKEPRSFTGAIQEAYQVLPGGHLCWYAPTTNTWWLRRLSDGVLTDIEVGVADPARGTVREFICQHSLHLQSTKMTLDAFDARVGAARQRALRASQSRAYWLRASIQQSRGTRPLELEAEVRAELQAARGARQTLPPPLPWSDGSASRSRSRSWTPAVPPKDVRQTLRYGATGRTPSSIRPTSISAPPPPNGVVGARTIWAAVAAVAALILAVACVFVLRKGDGLSAAAASLESGSSTSTTAPPSPVAMALPTAVAAPIPTGMTARVETFVDPIAPAPASTSVHATSGVSAVSPNQNVAAADRVARSRPRAAPSPSWMAGAALDGGARSLPDPAVPAGSIAPAASAAPALSSPRSSGSEIGAGGSVDEFGGRE